MSGRGSARGVLAIMGSGETAPAMAKVHRALLDRLGPDSGPVVVVDTPYGFQENADDLSRRISAYFAESVGRDAVVATYRSRGVDGLTTATALARIGEARYAMAGPGSPSYALRHWVEGPIPAALEGILASGGALTMASAAALTLGVVTVPVYEIYKVGARHPRPRGRPHGGRHPPLRQRRGRQSRHPLLLPRRAPTADPRGAAP